MSVVREIWAEMENDGHGIYDFVAFADCIHYSVFSPNLKQSLSPSDSSTTTNSNNSQSPNDDKTTKQALSFLTQDYQDMVNHHNFCLNHLREATREAEALRGQNASLRIMIRDLKDRMALIIQSTNPPPSISPNFQEISLIRGFGGLSIGENAGGRDVFVGSHSPTSVMEMQIEPVRVGLPKSISVRSGGYLKTNNPCSLRSGPASGSDSRSTRSSNRIQAADPAAGKQKVYVQGGMKEGDAMELEVYNQGMVKTELCNKWQEMGICPYGDHCQFAHGIEELRPVLRHPRYKTEVCRMVLAGDPCPYGHRCHFRHALTEQEKVMMPGSPDARGGHSVNPAITSNKVR